MYSSVLMQDLLDIKYMSNQDDGTCIENVTKSFLRQDSISFVMTIKDGCSTPIYNCFVMTIMIVVNFSCCYCY